MKSVCMLFALFVVAAVEVAADEPPNIEKFKKNMQECMTQFGIDDALLKSNNIPDDKKCFFKCMKIKMGVMNDKGDFTIADFKTKNPNAPPEMVKNLESCATTSKKADSCDTAKAFTDCIRQKKKQ